MHIFPVSISVSRLELVGTVKLSLHVKMNILYITLISKFTLYTVDLPDMDFGAWREHV